MKKIAVYCLQLLAIVGVASLTSCGSSDPVTPVGNPTITSVADPTAGYQLTSGATLYKFEKGDKVKVKVSANIPGGAQIFQVWKKVGTGTDTDVSATYSAQFPAAGATSYEKSFEVNVGETFNATTAAENKIVVTFKVRNSQMTPGTFVTSKFEYEVVAQGQGGGGGTQRLLRASATVTLGAQGSTSPSYVASQAISTGSSTGLYSSADAANLSSAAKKTIDITFGVADNTGTAAVGATATNPQIISPDTRAGKGFNNPLGTDAQATTFKTTTLTSLSAVTASDVNNNIDHSTGTVKFVDIQANKVYSFVNAQGAKGYILIKTITGTQDNRDAQIEVLVQQLQ